MSIDTIRLRHGRVELALHNRSAAGGTPLLLLHALHGDAHEALEAVRWSGPVHALDFAGHGASGWLRGGGYSPELFAADADAALAHVADEDQRVCVAGEGVGAYAALLLAGARPNVVKAALLAPGHGMGSGDGEPDFARQPRPWGPIEEAEPGARSDPALARLNDEFKPAEYVTSFAERAARLLLLDDGDPSHPAWWELAARAGRSEKVGPDLAAGLDALGRYA